PSRHPDSSPEAFVRADRKCPKRGSQTRGPGASECSFPMSRWRRGRTHRQAEQSSPYMRGRLPGHAEGGPLNLPGLKGGMHSRGLVLREGEEGVSLELHRTGCRTKPNATSGDDGTHVIWDE